MHHATRLQHRAGTQANTSLLLSVPSSWPPCSSRRWCQRWRLRHRSATPSGAVDSGDATWTISGRRGGDLEPKILGLPLWVVADSVAYLRLSPCRCSSLGVILGYWIRLVIMRRPNDDVGHKASSIVIHLEGERGD